MTENSNGKIVQLNVGGTLYEVTRDTLDRCEGSMLASLISDHWKEGNADSNEPIFIDRNGCLFEYVLDYLRTNKVFVPPSVSVKAVKEEFQYYGINVNLSQVLEKYGSKYHWELKEKIWKVEHALKSLQMEDKTITFMLYLENMAFKDGGFAGRPKCSIRIPDEYKPFHFDILRECAQLRGLRVSDHCMYMDIEPID